MNIILIISDTVRADYCGCYGDDWVKTPNIDALAAKSALMENFYCASFPTGPFRKDVHSGRFTFAYTNWGGKRPEDEIVIAELLQEAGYTTAYIGDTNNSPQYGQGFDHMEVVPSQASRLDEVPETVELPAAEHKLRFPRSYAQRIARNAMAYGDETERRAARTMTAAHKWLEGQYGGSEPFFLWVDTFDPHEPWDPPRYYIDQYDPGYEGDELMEPAYESAGYASEREIQHMRCMYAGKLTMVDRWIGYLLDGAERMGLMDDTAILFTSDHGFYHGEHGFIGKVVLDRENNITGRWPLYSTIAHAPLIVSAPGLPAGRRHGTFCQGPDIMPTILDLVNVARPSRVQGKSLLPVLSGETDRNRDFAVSSLTYITDEEVRCPTSYWTDEHLYIYGGDEWQSELYELETDPGETENTIEERPGVAEKLHGQLLEFLEEIECPAASIEARREFRPKPREDLPYKKLL